MVLVLGLLLSPEDVPPYVNGPDGFFYVLVTDQNGRPVLAMDGSPLYDGEKIIPGQVLRHSSSWHKLQSRMEAVSKDSLKDSSWRKGAIHVEIGAGFIEQMAAEYREKPEDFLHLLSGVQRDKAEILRRILFENRIHLEEPLEGERKNEPGFINLQALMRNAKNPLPDKVKVQFPVEDPSWAFYVWKLTSELFVEVSLDHLSFEFDEKWVTFDPVTNSFKVKLLCKGAVIKGPTREVGRVREFHKYLDVATYYDKPNYLIEGHVGALSLELEVRLRQDENNFWRIELVRKKDPESDAYLPSVTLTSLDAHPTVVLNYESPVKDRKTGGQTNTQEFNLTPQILTVINKMVSDRFEDALKGVLYAEELAFAIDLKNIFDVEDPGLARLQTRLASLKVGEEGVRLEFDARLKILHLSNCLPPHFSADQIVFGEAKDLKSNNTTKPLSWQIQAVSQPDVRSQWISSSRKQDDINISLSPSLLDLVAEGGRTSGLFCLGSLWWSNRPGSIPPAIFSLGAKPELRFEDQRLAVPLSGDLKVQSRISDPLPRFSDQVAQLKVSGELQIANDKNQKALRLEGLSGIRLPDYPSEERLFQDLVSGTYSDKGSQFSISYSRFLAEWPQLPVRLLDLDFTSAAVQARFIYAPQEVRERDAIEKEKNKQASRSREVPETAFVQDSRPVVSSSFKLIQWGSNVPEAYYSWRWRNVSDGQWSVWTAFEARNSVTLSLHKPGKYEFQILGMNSFFEIESYPKQLDFTVKSRPVSSESSVGESSAGSGGGPVIDSQQIAESSSVQKRSKKVSDPGAFGCTVAILTSRDAKTPWGQIAILLLSLGFAILRFSMHRFPRQFARRERSSAFGCR